MCVYVMDYSIITPSGQEKYSATEVAFQLALSGRDGILQLRFMRVKMVAPESWRMFLEDTLPSHRKIVL